MKRHIVRRVVLPLRIELPIHDHPVRTTAIRSSPSKIWLPDTETRAPLCPRRAAKCISPSTAAGRASSKITWLFRRRPESLQPKVIFPSSCSAPSTEENTGSYRTENLIHAPRHLHKILLRIKRHLHAVFADVRDRRMVVARLLVVHLRQVHHTPSGATTAIPSPHPLTSSAETTSSFPLDRALRSCKPAGALPTGIACAGAESILYSSARQGRPLCSITAVGAKPYRPLINTPVCARLLAPSTSVRRHPGGGSRYCSPDPQRLEQLINPLPFICPGA